MIKARETFGETKCELDLGSHTAESLDHSLRSSQSPNRSGKLLEAARKFIGTPFEYESALAKIPDDCVRICLSSFDCVTFVYHMLAMAWANSFEEYIRRLREVRYTRDADHGLSNDPVRGNFFDFACEALFENAVDRGMLVDITQAVAGGARLTPIRVELAAVARPKEHDISETLVYPRFGERPITQHFIPSRAIPLVDREAVKPGDIVVFTLGSANKDGTPRKMLVRHVAIVASVGDEIHFIHATKDFYWRPTNSSLQDRRASGRFLISDPCRELIGVGVAGCFVGDEHAVTINGIRYFGYDLERPRGLANYAGENFVGVKFMRAPDESSKLKARQ